MLDSARIAANQIRLKQKSIAGFLTNLADNKFDHQTLLQIYTVLGDSAEYQEYIGKAYTGSPSVSFTGGGGADAAGTAIITDGILSSVNITDPGHDYTSAPDVVFTSGGGAGAAAHALLSGSGDTVGSVVVDNKSLLARLKTKSVELDAEFAGL